MSHAPDRQNIPPSNAPYGTQPRRSRGPLVALLVAFVCWFAFLVVLALREAALR